MEDLDSLERGHQRSFAWKPQPEGHKWYYQCADTQYIIEQHSVLIRVIGNKQNSNTIWCFRLAGDGSTT